MLSYVVGRFRELEGGKGDFVDGCCSIVAAALFALALFCTSCREEEWIRCFINSQTLPPGVKQYVTGFCLWNDGREVTLPPHLPPPYKGSIVWYAYASTYLLLAAICMYAPKMLLTPATHRYRLLRCCVCWAQLFMLMYFIDTRQFNPFLFEFPSEIHCGWIHYTHANLHNYIAHCLLVHAPFLLRCYQMMFCSFFFLCILSAFSFFGKLSLHCFVFCRDFTTDGNLQDFRTLCCS